MRKVLGEGWVEETGMQYSPEQNIFRDTLVHAANSGLFETKDRIEVCHRCQKMVRETIWTYSTF